MKTKNENSTVFNYWNDNVKKFLRKYWLRVSIYFVGIMVYDFLSILMIYECIYSAKNIYYILLILFFIPIDIAALVFLVWECFIKYKKEYNQKLIKYYKDIRDVLKRLSHIIFIIPSVGCVINIINTIGIINTIDMISTINIVDAMIVVGIGILVLIICWWIYVSKSTKEFRYNIISYDIPLKVIYLFILFIITCYLMGSNINGVIKSKLAMRFISFSYFFDMGRLFLDIICKKAEMDAGKN